MKPTDSRCVAQMARILDMLTDRDMDLAQLTEALLFSRSTSTLRYCDHMRRQHKLHVCGWRPPAANGVRIPIYRIGRGRSVPKPSAKTKSQINHEYRLRHGIGKRPAPGPSARPFDQLFMGTTSNDARI